MSATTPGDIANTTWDGDTAKTAEANSQADQPGYPVVKLDGSYAWIVEKKPVANQGEVLVDYEGNEYVIDVNGKAVELDEVEADERLPEAEVTTVTAEEAAEANAKVDELAMTNAITPEEKAELEQHVDKAVSEGLPAAGVSGEIETGASNPDDEAAAAAAYEASQQGQVGQS